MIIYDAIPEVFQHHKAPVNNGKLFCLNCKKTLDEKNFFKSNRTDKFLNGYLPHCKTCVVMGIVDTDPTTFLSFLKELDIPYISSEWRTLVVKKDARSGSIFGKYASKMKLNQFKRYRWIDSKTLEEQQREILLDALRQEEDSETAAEQRLEEMFSMDDLDTIVDSTKDSLNIVSSTMYGLTEETSKYGLTVDEISDLKFKWGQDYSEEDFLKLEQLFTDMQNAYIIQDPLALSNAQIICKMTVKMNKLLDIDDIESASKISRQLDLFVKSANLAPVQQKDRQTSTFSISELALLVEKEGGFVPEFYVEKKEDKIDMLLVELQEYTMRLVQGEGQLGDMIENAQTILAQDKLRKEAEFEEEEIDEFADFEQDVLGTPIEYEEEIGGES